jgi:glyoxylase-like metal-dependent hydrolase (beta-lactamase superfamily II)/rhodanese-related sulfurtransferase
MYIEQLYTNCLSEAAYYIESDGEVAIIDPLRDTQKYLDLAESRNAKIKYIFETHFHADFVSGHLDLAAKTNAPIVYGPDAHTNFPIHQAKDEEIFAIGKIKIKALHTPGHTLESTCYLLLDENNQEHAIFTGDTLFVGDVGRPDLFGARYTKEHLAEMMYLSLQSKIMPLQDNVIVYPAHGPGSSCGKNLGPETFSTIGAQKQTNYALQPQTKDEFVKVVTTGLNPPPAYFPINAKINKEGYDSLDIVLMQSKQALPVAAFKNKITEDTIILDTRKAEVFTQGFIPKSIFIGLESRFAEWVGTLIPFDKPILLVTEESRLDETLIRLSRVGYDNVIGYLNGGFAAWQNAGEEIDLIIDVDADELAMDLKFDDNIVIMDVRKEGEFNTGHLVGAKNSPLQEFTNLLAIASIDEQDNVYVHCAGGYRSVIACSLIKKEGVHNIRNIVGGWSKIKDVAELEIVVPSTTLN